jgi:glycyl-tRNA synthetase beta subunit
MPLLKNAILDFSRTLQIHSFIYNVTFMEPTSKKRIGYKDDPIVLKFGTRNINISALRNIIAQLPHKKQLMFKYDNEGVNRYWRLNVLNEIIEQEIWLKEAEEMGLANSDEYKTLAKVNESNAVLNSFLNSLRTQNIDAVNGRLSKIIKNASPKLSSSYDATYFKNQEHVLKNFLDNPSTN